MEGTMKSKVHKNKIIATQETFFKEVWGKKIDFSGIKIPPEKNNCGLILCIPSKTVLGNQMAFSEGKTPFKTCPSVINVNLDNLIDINFGRDATVGSYIIRCRMSKEPDIDLKGFSADKIAKKKINTMTFRERVILGWFLYWWKGWVLDRKNITLCSGSRLTYGRVPCINTEYEVCFSWFGHDFFTPGLRARRVVSC